MGPKNRRLLAPVGHCLFHVWGKRCFRLAIAGGKGIPFKQPTVGAPPQDFGTDGGTHNFLRYLEDWGGGAPSGTLWYEGSIVSMYYSHQAVGTYKCFNTVYNPPTRAYQFDTNFLAPNLQPPLTPMLRAVNTIGFTQILLPTQLEMSRGVLARQLNCPDSSDGCYFLW